MCLLASYIPTVIRACKDLKAALHSPLLWRSSNQHVVERPKFGSVVNLALATGIPFGAYWAFSDVVFEEELIVVCTTYTTSHWFIV